MLKFSGTKQPKRILDVGCGIGGTTRHLAAKFPDAEVIGITLSPQQVQRANQLAKDRGLKVKVAGGTRERSGAERSGGLVRLSTCIELGRRT